MRGVSERNFSSVKYGKFIWPQAKRSWSFTRAAKKKERCCADPCCDWDTFGPHWKCSFKLWMAQQCGASSWSYHELSLHSFFLGLFQVTCWSFIFLCFFILFVCWQFSLTHTTMIAYSPPQSIRRKRSSSDLNSQPTASQPYPLATRVPECPQSFTSFLVIHFHIGYFPVCLFR